MADAEPENIARTSEPQASEQDAQQDQRNSARRKWLIRLGLLVLVVALLWGAWYLLFGRNHVSTDNAYVNAEMAQVTPLIGAQAIDVLVSDTQSVKKGDILVKLDPTNAKIAVAQAEADLAEARRRFRQTDATSDSLAAPISFRRVPSLPPRRPILKRRASTCSAAKRWLPMAQCRATK